MGGVGGASVSTARVSCDTSAPVAVTAVTKYPSSTPLFFGLATAMFNRQIVGRPTRRSQQVVRLLCALSCGYFSAYAYGCPKTCSRQLTRRTRLHGDSVADSLCPKKLSFVQKMPIDRIAWLRLCRFSVVTSSHWSLGEEEKIMRRSFGAALAAIPRVPDHGCLMARLTETPRLPSRVCLRRPWRSGDE
jgi:hypothetical protein